ncbi:tetratricopeptide repeat protein [Alkalithermobacter paradoxus]|uniref:Tetratricopeptide repeat protein n=1 Tax=Alkalithermobacter paradoxus TaxID=29349 RepID=A0A1V4I6B3_9FIRM|nr:tetratricopeptide repeat protein [[Clostridium] thermoalcaliphilum]
MDILSLGQKIKKLRKQKDLTLKELAGSRITAAQISHIERDKSYPSQDLLEYFSNKLGVTVDYLVESKEMQARKLAINLILKGEIYIKSKDFEKAKEEIYKAIDISKEYELNENFAKAKYLLGVVYFAEKNYEVAIDMLQQSLLSNVKISNIDGMIRCYIELGKIYMKEKLYKVSLSKFVQVENIFKEHDIKNYEIEKELYTNIAYCYMKLGDNSKSLQYAKEVEVIDEKVKNIINKGNNLLLIGSNFLDVGDYDKAKEYLNEAVKIFEEENKKNEQALTYLKVSKIYSKLQKDEEALEYIKKAYIIKREYEDEEVVEILFEYIKKLIHFGDFENAKRYSKRALSISIKLKDKTLEYKSLKYYSKVHKQEGNMEAAIEIMKKCLDIASQMNDKKKLANIYFELADVYSNISKEEELKYYSKGIKLYKELGIINN